MSEPITYSDIVKAWRDKNISTASDLEVALSDYKIFSLFIPIK